MERGRIQGLPKFLEYPLLSQERVKLRTSNFVRTHILSIDRNKSPLQISGKVAGCVVRTLKTFQSTHVLGASRGLLCDSYAVLFLYITDYCLSNAMHRSIGQKIKSFGVSGLRIVTWFLDRSSPNLEHSFYVRCTTKIFWRPTLVAMVKRNWEF